MSDATHGVVGGTVLLCLVAAAIPGGTALVAGETTADPLHPQVETDQVEQIVAVQADGDAEWRVRYITEIGNDQNESEAFDALAADIRSNPDNYTDRFAQRIRSTVRTAENATDREMAATDFTVSARTTPVNGIVTYTFEWSNFANVSAGGERVAVGDAIEGYFLQTDTRLQIQWPEGWTPTSVAPEPDSSPGRSVVWRGATTDFGPEQPSVVLEPAAGATTTGTDAGPGGTDTDPGSGDTQTPGPGPDGEAGGGLPMALFAVVALVVVGVGIAWWRRPSGGPTATDAPDAPDEAPGTGAATGAAAASESDDADEIDTTDADDAGVDEADAETPVAEIDEELLSNEERVLRLLEERGGRMKQQEVVEALDWTEAKTSQVVSGMREAGDIDSFRLGRENVLTLPDEEIDPTEGGDDGV